MGTPDMGAAEKPEAGKKSGKKGRGGTLFEKAAEYLKNARDTLPEKFDAFAQQAFEDMDTKAFTHYLEELSATKQLSAITSQQLFFKAENLALQKKEGEQEAREKTVEAIKLYTQIRDTGRKMKAAGQPHEKIFTYFVMQQGEYKDENSYATDILASGIGNCEARAKLMVMLVEDVFGKEVTVFVESTNVLDPKSGKLVPHVRAIVKDKNNYYVLELPKPKKITGSDMKKRKTYGTDMFARAYLVNAGKEKYAASESVLPKGTFDGGKTDTVFALPHAPTIEKSADVRMNYSDAVEAELQKMNPRIKAVKRPRAPGTKEKSTESAGEKFLDYSFLRTLDDPAVAEHIVSKAVREQRSKISLQGLLTITPECAAILAQLDDRLTAYAKARQPLLHNYTYDFKNWGEIRIGDPIKGITLSEASAQAFQPFQGELHIVLQGDLNPKVAKTFTNKYNLYLFVCGSIAKDAGAALGTPVGRWAYNNVQIKTTGSLDPEIVKTWNGEFHQHVGFVSDRGLDPRVVQYAAQNSGHTKMTLYNVQSTLTSEHIAQIGKTGSKYLVVTFKNGWMERNLFKDFSKHMDFFKIVVPKVDSAMADSIALLGDSMPSSFGTRLDLNAKKPPTSDARNKIFKGRFQQIYIQGEGGYTLERDGWRRWE